MLSPPPPPPSPAPNSTKHRVRFHRAHTVQQQRANNNTYTNKISHIQWQASASLSLFLAMQASSMYWRLVAHSICQLSHYYKSRQHKQVQTTTINPLQIKSTNHHYQQTQRVKAPTTHNKHCQTNSHKHQS